MLEKHNPSWGNKVVGSGQVHCVRRLGLSDEQWESVRPTGPERMFAGERHITCVKMSPEHADEVSRVPGDKRNHIEQNLYSTGNCRFSTTLNFAFLDIRLPWYLVSPSLK
jgi:hypothetical protein